MRNQTLSPARSRLQRGLTAAASLLVGGKVIAWFQAAVIGVSAAVLPILVSVNHLDFGTVFPGEKLTEQYTVSLAPEFQGQTLPYTIGTRRKPLLPTHPEYPNGGDPALAGYYLDLCPFLTLTGETGEGDTVAAAALTKPTDPLDVWDVLLNAPAIANQKTGGVAQDHTGGIVTANGEYGCDLTVNINPACGNGIPEPGEECDLGLSNGQPGSTCDARCKTTTACTGMVDVALVFDRSGSMNYDNGARLADAKTAAKGFVDLLGIDDHASLVTYSSSVTLAHQLNRDFAALKGKIDAITATGATNIGDVIKAANAELTSVRARKSAAHVEILLTDGRANKPNGPGHGEFPADVQYAVNQAAAAAAAGIKIFTIGLGTDVNATMLQQIATLTGAKFYASPTSGDLSDIYQRIAGEFCPQTTRCGDGIRQTPNDAGFNEQCDDGNTNDQDTCRNNCTENVAKTFCGDGVTQTPNDDGFREQCDDANAVDNDACHNDCTNNIVTPVCGNGIPESGEECDAGQNNGTPGSTCNAVCDTVVSCSQPVDVALVFDRSGSMNYDQGSRLSDAKSASKGLVDLLHINDHAALVSYASLATTDAALDNNFAALKTKIDAISAKGATNIGDAIKAANAELSSVRARSGAAHVEILLTDGRANKPNGPGHGEFPADVQYAVNQAAAAAAAGIKIFTIGLGSDVNATMLQQMAQMTGGLYYASPSSADLAAIYNHLALDVCPDARCGDGKINLSNEQCDAGIANDVACTPNYEASCNYCSATCQLVPLRGPYCGDGVKNGPEQCDDANTNDADACRNDCTLPPIGRGPAATGPPGGGDSGIAMSGPAGPQFFCGDGVGNQPSEQCDDGNENNDDRCRTDCTINGQVTGVTTDGSGAASGSSGQDRTGSGGEGTALSGGGGGAYAPDPNLSVTLTVYPPVAMAGSTITYTVVITNTGGAVGNNVVVTDTLPAGFSLVDTGVHTASWNLGMIGSLGGTISVVYDVKIADDVPAGVYENVAAVSITNGKPGALPPSASARVEVLAGAVLGSQYVENPAPQLHRASQQPENAAASAEEGWEIATGTVDFSPPLGADTGNGSSYATTTATTTSSTSGGEWPYLWFGMLAALGLAAVFALVSLRRP